jgi:hypothetical protein
LVKAGGKLPPYNHHTTRYLDRMKTPTGPTPVRMASPLLAYMSGTGLFHANGMLVVTLAAHQVRAMIRFDEVVAKFGLPGGCH